MNPDSIMVLIPLGFAWAVVAIVRSVSENSTRRKAIEKGVPEDVARTLFQTAAPVGDQSLKYGAVAVSLALALAVIDSMGLDESRPLTYAIPLFFIGLALIGFHAYNAKHKAS